MIKCIDVYGQFDNKGTDHYYTYPQVLSPESRKLFLDPRADLGAFQIGVNVTDIFVLFCTTDGWWISIVKRNKHDMRQGYAMFSVCLGANRPKVGAEAVQLLRQGYEQFVDNRVWDNVQTDAWLQTHSLQLTPCAITPFTMPASLADGNNSAYRTFSNEVELQQTLTFISQKKYSKYSRIFLLPNTATPVSTGHRMQQVTVPVKKEYTIQHTPDTDPSVPTVALEGDTINIVYLRNGLKSAPISYKVGSQHRAAYLDGMNCTIQLQTPQIAGAKFYKQIRLHINVEKPITFGREFDDNGIKYDAATQTLSIPDNLNQNFKGSIRCAGYKSLTALGKDLCALRNGETRRLDFKEEPISVSVFIDGNRYSVDAPITMQKAQEWEKKGIAVRTGANSLEVRPNKEDDESVISLILEFLGAAFALLVVGYGLYALLCWPMDWKIWPFQHGEAKNVEATADNGLNEQQSATASFTEASDSTYFKSHDTWNENELQSETGKQLLAALKNGNIDDIVAAHYNCFQGVKDINGYWKPIEEFLNGIDPAKRDKAKTEIRRLCKTGVVNLSELQNALKTVAAESAQPKPQSANESPATKPATAHTTPQAKPKENKPAETKTKKTVQQNKSAANKTSESQKGKGKQKAVVGDQRSAD